MPGRLLKVYTRVIKPMRTPRPCLTYHPICSLARACEAFTSPCAPRSEPRHEGDEITPYACEEVEAVTAPGCLGFMIGNGRCLLVKCVACACDCRHAGYTFFVLTCSAQNRCDGMCLNAGKLHRIACTIIIRCIALMQRHSPQPVPCSANLATPSASC